MTARPALDDWLARAGQILDLVTKPDAGPHPGCWSDDPRSYSGQCGANAAHPSGLCDPHHHQLVPACAEEIDRCRDGSPGGGTQDSPDRRG